jgi:hypothetical protein
MGSGGMHLLMVLPAAAAGKIQQLQAAYVLERNCEHKGCEFVVNTCAGAACSTAPDIQCVMSCTQLYKRRQASRALLQNVRRTAIELHV